MLQGEKIGFVLAVNQLGNTTILKEIKKILFAGAEIFIILLNPAEEKRGTLEKLQNIFNPACKKIPGEIAKNGLASLTSLDDASYHPRQPFLDLLVLVPDSEILLGCLERITIENSLHLPLVLITALENMPALPLNRISSLMKKKGIFFVPFGPVENPEKQNGGRAGKNPILYSRMDLLVETCTAALKGYQLKPSTWEDLSFPH